MPRSSEPPAPLFGVAPCDDCQLARQCRARLLACHQFAAFVHGDPEDAWRREAREPQRVLYTNLLTRGVRGPDRKPAREAAATTPAASTR